MNSVVHFEIPANDTSRAEKFYSDVFGWQIQKFPMPGGDYYMVTTTPSTDKGPTNPGAINGGLVQRDNQSAKEPVLVIDVPNLDEHLKKIEAAGGKVVMPKMQVGDMGLYARVTDTEENIIGVWQDLK